MKATPTTAQQSGLSAASNGLFCAADDVSAGFKSDIVHHAKELGVMRLTPAGDAP